MQKIPAKEVATDREVFGASDLDQSLKEIKGKKFMDFVNVKDFGADPSGLKDCTQAIREAIESLEKGQTLYIPEGNFYIDEKNEDYLFLLDKPVRVIGEGYYSTFIVSQNVSATTDIFKISPDMSEGGEGYEVSNIKITTEASSRSGRHAFYIDISGDSQQLKRALFRKNYILPTGGYSIYLNNPTSTTGFYTSQIENNMIWGGMNLQRLGDSVTITGNTFAGYNGIDISLINGSNTLVFAFNNVTLRDGVILRNGHNVKFIYNNIECGYSDANPPNGALVDIDGSESSNSYGMLTIDVVGNNITYRPEAPDGIDGIRINKARRTLVENNHITHKNSNMINITSLAQNTSLGYNLYSAIDPEGYIVDNGVNTIQKEVHRIRDQTGHEVIQYIAKNVRREGTNRFEKFDSNYIETLTNTFPETNIVWQYDNTYNSKHIINTIERNSEGNLEPEVKLAEIEKDKVIFQEPGIGLRDVNGDKHTLTIDGSGNLLLDGAIV